MTYLIQPLVDAIEAILHSHELGQPGAYRRWNWQKGERAAQGSGVSTQPPFAGSRDLGLNPYGCADAANLLYTINHFPQDPAERAGWVAVLRGMQDPAGGLYTEATHTPLHTTAHCIASLELFDALPAYPLNGLAELRQPAAMEAFLDGLDWQARPWTESHKGAGLYAAMTLAGEASVEWQARYFAWLARENDPATGFWRRGCIRQAEQSGVVSRFPYLAGSFHYLFNHEYGRMPLAHPAAMIDTCLELRRSDPFPLGSSVGFAEIDWVYCLTRASRQSGHRYAEVRAALEGLAEQYIPYLLGLNAAEDDGLNDLHQLFGAACGLAELQSALPGLIRTDKPLRLVLDRRPFI
jgi:hypothetical protein